MTGKITAIQRFSLNDGPGIRTTVFLKGCNLKCYWCHNPEAMSPDSELQLYPALCVGCGRCLGICPHGAISAGAEEAPFDRSKCTGCGICAGVCCSGARMLAGKDISADEVMRVVLRDEPYYANTGGGVTLSGGEPMLQHCFITELLTLCKANGINTAVETAGNVPWDWFSGILGLVDLFIYDIKHVDEYKHWNATGGSCAQILGNLGGLLLHKARIRVRVPVIPGFNADPESMDCIATRLAALRGIESVELMPFHRLGLGKYESIGTECAVQNLAAPTNEEMNRYRIRFKQSGARIQESGER